MKLVCMAGYLARRKWSKRCGKERLEKSGTAGCGVAGHVKGKGGRGCKRAWRCMSREKRDVCG